MPPNGFKSVSVPEATIRRLDRIQDALGEDCGSRAQAVATAAAAFDVGDDDAE
jgi:hypothetical protein